jgi:thiosulfate reductase cytochrome b subunit
MYSVYERQWHWLQTVAISGLLFTGLVIHKPEMFSIFDFRGMVLIHNALAVVMVINAALAAFYYLVSGEIQQFLPEPRGLFGKMFAQAKFYLWGIFRGEPHPFDKTPERKLNPLQQMTYLALLNVLLPAQVITGVLMWGISRWPELTGSLGGLAVLAPLHTLIAWVLASFIALHVYLTTTGPTPMENIRAMLFGWEQVETHADGHADGATEAAD